MNEERKMRNILHTFVRALLAGMIISVGGVLYLSTDVKVAGALLFTTGLLTICTQGFNLFTGKVGYFVLQKEKGSYLKELLVIWLGNWAGTVVMGLLLQPARITASIKQTAAAWCQVKMDDSLLSLLILGICCGILMFVAVDGYEKTNKSPVILFLAISAFILCGFEHCVADMFYFALAGIWSARALVCIVVISLGNSIGGMIFPLLKQV